MGLKAVFRRIGTVAAAPIVIPARAAKKGVESIAMKKIVSLLVRHALTTIGGAGFVASDSDVEAVASALLVLVGIAHSLWEKRKSAAPAAP
jgi:hypothetical protein